MKIKYSKSLNKQNNLKKIYINSDKCIELQTFESFMVILFIIKKNSSSKILNFHENFGAEIRKSYI